VALGFFELILTLSAAHCWFGTIRITMEAGRLVAAEKMLGLGKTREAALDEIASVEPAVTGQANQAQRWNVRVTPRRGEPFTINTALADKREAEWVAARIRKEMPESSRP
jgi:hypothetical protein